MTILYLVILEEKKEKNKTNYFFFLTEIRWGYSEFESQFEEK